MDLNVISLTKWRSSRYPFHFLRICWNSLLSSGTYYNFFSRITSEYKTSDIKAFCWPVADSWCLRDRGRNKKKGGEPVHRKLWYIYEFIRASKRAIWCQSLTQRWLRTSRLSHWTFMAIIHTHGVALLYPFILPTSLCTSSLNAWCWSRKQRPTVYFRGYWQFWIWGLL